MSCTKPLKAYRSLIHRTETGKQLLSFKLSDVSPYGPYDHVDLPCGQCLSCRITRSRQWAIRCIHEAQNWQQNCFITLTYADEYMPISTKQCETCPIYKRRLIRNENPCGEGSVCKKDFQDFMKRLRKRFKGYEPVPGTNHFPIRYFHCGEYGEKLRRPHHHACVFNFQFPDRVQWVNYKNSSNARIRVNQQEHKLYTSSILTELWGHGIAIIGEVTWQSAAYVARYITKKINGADAAVHYLNGHPDMETGECYYLEPEYITMSRRPGIGAYWFEKYGESQYDKDYITHLGKKFGIPPFYDKLLDKLPESKHHLPTIKHERRQRALKDLPPSEKMRLARLRAKETILQQRFTKLMRNLENGTTNVQRLRHQEQNLPSTAILSQCGACNSDVPEPIQ